MTIKRVEYIVIHCADTYARMDIGAAEIREWHVQGNGWSDIGYHWVIRRDGRLEQGRSETQAGAHVAGYNSRAIGVCMVGGKGDDNKPSPNFTQDQWDALHDLIHELQDRYPNAIVCGHRDLDSKKACPTFDVARWHKAAFAN